MLDKLLWLFMLFLIGTIIWVLTASATTATWTRNSEPDLQGYRVYICFVAGCTVTHTDPTATVPQPPVGGVPSYVFDPAGQSGAIAVSAVDLAGNESVLSAQAAFPPPVQPPTPKNLRFKNGHYK